MFLYNHLINIFRKLCACNLNSKETNRKVKCSINHKTSFNQRSLGEKKRFQYAVTKNQYLKPPRSKKRKSKRKSCTYHSSLYRTNQEDQLYSTDYLHRFSLKDGPISKEQILLLKKSYFENSNIKDDLGKLATSNLESKVSKSSKSAIPSLKSGLGGLVSSGLSGKLETSDLGSKLSKTSKSGIPTLKDGLGGLTSAGLSGKRETSDLGPKRSKSSKSGIPTLKDGLAGLTSTGLSGKLQISDLGEKLTKSDEQTLTDSSESVPSSDLSGDALTKEVGSRTPDAIKDNKNKARPRNKENVKRDRSAIPKLEKGNLKGKKKKRPNKGKSNTKGNEKSGLNQISKLELKEKLNKKLFQSDSTPTSADSSSANDTQVQLSAFKDLDDQTKITTEASGGSTEDLSSDKKRPTLMLNATAKSPPKGRPARKRRKNPRKTKKPGTSKSQSSTDSKDGVGSSSKNTTDVGKKRKKEIKSSDKQSKEKKVKKPVDASKDITQSSENESTETGLTPKSDAVVTKAEDVSSMKSDKTDKETKKDKDKEKKKEVTKDNDFKKSKDTKDDIEDSKKNKKKDSKKDEINKKEKDKDSKKKDDRQSQKDKEKEKEDQKKKEKEDKKNKEKEDKKNKEKENKKKKGKKDKEEKKSKDKGSKKSKKDKKDKKKNGKKDMETIENSSEEPSTNEVTTSEEITEPEKEKETEVKDEAISVQLQKDTKKTQVSTESPIASPVTPELKNIPTKLEEEGTQLKIQPLLTPNGVVDNVYSQNVKKDDKDCEDILDLISTQPKDMRNITFGLHCRICETIYSSCCNCGCLMDANRVPCPLDKRCFRYPMKKSRSMTICRPKVAWNCKAISRCSSYSSDSFTLSCNCIVGNNPRNSRCPSNVICIS